MHNQHPAIKKALTEKIEEEAKEGRLIFDSPTHEEPPNIKGKLDKFLCFVAVNGSEEEFKEVRYWVYKFLESKAED